MADVGALQILIVLAVIAFIASLVLDLMARPGVRIALCLGFIFFALAHYSG